MKKIVPLFLAASLSMLPASAAEAAGFSDLTDRSDIIAAEALRLMGVMDGYGNGSFRTNAQLTRVHITGYGNFAKITDGAKQVYGGYSGDRYYYVLKGAGGNIPATNPTRLSKSWMTLWARGARAARLFPDKGRRPL